MNKSNAKPGWQGSRMGLAAALALGLATPTWAIQAFDGPRRPVTSNKFFAVSVQAQAGYADGEAHETVFDYFPDGSRYKVSELTWDIKGIFLGGGVATLTLFDRVHVNGGFWAPLNKGNGGMDDYDWLLYEKDSPWTDRSHSEADVTRGRMWDVNGGVDVIKYKGLALKGLGGYKENFWRWEDRLQEYVYSSDPWNYPAGFRDVRGPGRDANVINYEQTFKIPYVGAGVDYTWQRLTVALYALWSQWVSATDRDEHLARSLVFEERFSNGDYFAAGGRVTYTFPVRVFVQAAVDYQTIDQIIGDVTVTDATGAREEFKDGAGIDNQLSVISLSVGYTY